MTSLLRKLKPALAVSLTLAATTTWSDDAALYDDAAPADAVFVRVLSGEAKIAQPVTFAGVEIPVSEDMLDTYIAISAAQLEDVAPGSYYSLTGGQTGLIAIEEPARDAATKVHLILLNTGSDAVRLVVPGQMIEVVATLQPGHAASRAVNPVETELAVERVSDGALLGTFEVRLSRGRNLTFVAGDTSARMIENSVGPVLKLN